MRDAHATLFLDRAAAGHIEPWRRRWDPVMADQIAAHLTVTYPAEIPSSPVLCARLEAATRRTGPFRLRLGEISCLGEPKHGVFVEVEDVDGGWLSLRARVGFTAERLSVAPHVTLVHPRTSAFGPEAWAALCGTVLDVDVTVGEATVTAFDGRAWRTISSFDLVGPVPQPGPAIKPTCS